MGTPPRPDRCDDADGRPLPKSDLDVHPPGLFLGAALAAAPALLDDTGPSLGDDAGLLGGGGLGLGGLSSNNRAMSGCWLRKLLAALAAFSFFSRSSRLFRICSARARRVSSATELEPAAAEAAVEEDRYAPLPLPLARPPAEADADAFVAASCPPIPCSCSSRRRSSSLRRSSLALRASSFLLRWRSAAVSMVGWSSFGFWV